MDKKQLFALMVWIVVWSLSYHFIRSDSPNLRLVGSVLIGGYVGYLISQI